MDFLIHGQMFSFSLDHSEAYFDDDDDPVSDHGHSNIWKGLIILP